MKYSIGKTISKSIKENKWLSNNILMWSHYANKHDGICVAYDFKKPIELQTLALPIRYDNKRPIIFENELEYNNQ